MGAKQAALALATALAISAHTAPLPRDQAQVRAFRFDHPCPATGRTHGACPGWQVDHIRPLCAGGEDLPRNMHWLSVDDHRFKTLVDVRECRKLERAARTPAR